MSVRALDQQCGAFAPRLVPSRERAPRARAELPARSCGTRLGDDLARRKPPVAERGVQVAQLRAAVLVSDRQHLLALEPRGADLFKRRASRSSSFSPISSARRRPARVEPLLDLVSRARGLDEAQPVRARLAALFE